MLTPKQDRSIAAQILDKASEQQLFATYIGKQFTVPCTIRSPLPSRKDDNPSFGIYKSKGKLRWRDQATGQGGDVFDLVKEIYSLNFNEALLKVNEDFNLGIPISGNLPVHAQEKIGRKLMPKRDIESQRIQLSIRVHKTPEGTPRFTDADIEYWRRRKIQDIPYRLLRNRCYSTEYVFRNGSMMWKYTNDNPIFTYLYELEGQYYYKAYRPLAKDKGDKFYNDMKGVANRCLHGLWYLPATGEQLIITKSGKDAIVLDELGYNVVAIQGEGSKYPIDHQIMSNLKSRFKNIYLLYDNDYDKKENWGQNSAKVVSEIYSIRNICIPDIYKATDIDEMIVKYTKENVIHIINNLCK